MSEPTWVRVKDDKSGHEYSIPREPFQGETVIDKPAVNMYGEPLPAKPNVNMARRKDSTASEPSDQPADADTTESSEPTDTSTGTPTRAATTRRK